MAIFFRDPARVVPTAPGLVVSPADGRVEPVVRAVPPPELGLGDEPADAHLRLHERLRLPHQSRAGRRPRRAASPTRPGQFLSADLDKASEVNERNAILIEAEGGLSVGVVQIAGLVARRIVCWTRRAPSVDAGERIGMIRFGSRLDVYLPEGVDRRRQRRPARDRRRDDARASSPGRGFAPPFPTRRD